MLKIKMSNASFKAFQPRLYTMYFTKDDTQANFTRLASFIALTKSDTIAQSNYASCLKNS
jgi:hypothetical protein